ncbi:hypothetical protein ACHAWF_017975, partial [Thalassiosira exigua]
MVAPAPLCGSLITSRRSFLALAWTLTTLLSFFSFGVSVFLGTKITNQYNSMLTDEYAEWYRDEYGEGYNQNWNCRGRRGLNENENGNSQSGDQNNDREEEGERDREGCRSNDMAALDEEFFESLATTNSRGLVFAGVYTTLLGIALSLYGSTVVVGFMSLKGEYIPPCFSFRSMSIMEEDDTMNDEDSTTGPKKLWGEKIHRGIFLGCVVIFSNLMLLCAVIFGELQVHDNYNNYDEQQQHNLFSYRIEKISSVFAITCIVLAFVYILFAVIYTTCGGMDDDSDSQLDSSSRPNWANYEMQNIGGHLRHRGRRRMPNSMDKQEPLVGTGMPAGITDNEGFITEMVSTSTSSGSSMGSHPWERGKQFAGQL